MARRRLPLSSSVGRRRQLSVVTWLAGALCFLALLRLHCKYHYSIKFHNHKNSSYALSLSQAPKVAFLFLARQNLPLDFLWHNFFKNGDASNFSIYIHSRPGFVFNETTTRSAVFHHRQITNSVPVSWGSWTMIKAERLLLEAALQDPSNHRFVLLSDSCVPLYNFTFIYNYLMSSPKSFVDSFDVKQKRYNPMMSPVIPKHTWRKGSQWITLVRRHAEVIVKDDIVFTAFQKLCKLPRHLLSTNTSVAGKINLEGGLSDQKKRPRWPYCIPDEHYVQTLLILSGAEDEVERRTLTYSSWNHSASSRDTNSWHPITFQYFDARKQQIQHIKNINHVYYESEDRKEMCCLNSKPAQCFLFARKFSTKAAVRLLIAGVVGPYDPTVSRHGLY